MIESVVGSSFTQFTVAPDASVIDSVTNISMSPFVVSKVKMPRLAALTTPTTSVQGPSTMISPPLDMARLV